MRSLRLRQPRKFDMDCGCGPPLSGPIKRLSSGEHFLRAVTGLYGDAVLLRELLQRHLRPRADVLDHFRRSKPAKPCRIAMIRTTRYAEQETRREQIARAG